MGGPALHVNEVLKFSQAIKTLCGEIQKNKINDYHDYVYLCQKLGMGWIGESLPPPLLSTSMIRIYAYYPACFSESQMDM